MADEVAGHNVPPILSDPEDALVKELVVDATEADAIVDRVRAVQREPLHVGGVEAYGDPA
jgi:hypothetical protein